MVNLQALRGALFLTLLFLSPLCLALDDDAPIWLISAGSKEEAAVQSMRLTGVASLAASSAAPCPPFIKNEFDKYKAYFAKKYDNPAEDLDRCMNFQENIMLVAAVNGDPDVPYWLSGNDYSDMTFDEFKNRVLMPVTVNDEEDGEVIAFVDASNAPSVKDWVAEGKVTPIKDQGDCGSCWAYAGVSVLESAYLIKYGGNPQDVRFSEQQLVSCLSATRGYGSSGCNGGLSDEVLDYVSKNSLMLESDYPDVAKRTGRTGSCDNQLVQNTPESRKIRLSKGSYRVQSRSANALINAVAQQPTTFYFDVTNDFQSYSGGVYNSKRCGRNTNHAMNIVGYNKAAGTWLIRNSWGRSWGENGYARIVMNGDGTGMCGMYTQAYHTNMDFSSTLTDGGDGGGQTKSPTKPTRKKNPPRPKKKQGCKNTGQSKKYCKVWANQFGYCNDREYKQYMSTFCKKACKLC